MKDRENRSGCLHWPFEVAEDQGVVPRQFQGQAAALALVGLEESDGGLVEVDTLGETSPTCAVRPMSTRRRADRRLLRGAMPSCAGLRADVHALPLSPEEAEDLDGLPVRAAEPVWQAGVELGGLAGAEDQIALGEDEP